jgi:hypothetical protein
MAATSAPAMPAATVRMVASLSTEKACHDNSFNRPHIGSIRVSGRRQIFVELRLQGKWDRRAFPARVTLTVPLTIEE